MLRLRVLGSVTIERDGTAIAEIAELHKALALLALIATAGDRGISRDQVAAYLWPESDSIRARGALSQRLYTVRKQLDAPDLFAGTRRLALNPSVIGSDVRDFELALDQGDLEAAVGLYGGPFLDGLFVSNCVELERWIDAKRTEFAQRMATAMELLARRAVEHEDYAAAVGLWRRLATTEPGNSRAAAGLVEALAAAGDRAGALQAARWHEEFLRAEFDVPADPTVSTLAERIKRSSDGMRAVRAVEDTRQRNASGDVNVPNTESLARAQSPILQERAKSVDSPLHSSGGVRRRRAFQVGALLALALAGIVGARLAGHASEAAATMLSERRILITPFRNETGDTSLTSIGRLAVDWLVQGLVQTQLVEVVAPGVREDDLPALGAPDRRPNAGLVVRSSYSRAADSITFQAQVVEATTGDVVRAVGPVSGPISEPLIAIERLRQEIAGALATRVDPRLSRWSHAASQPTSFEAYRAFDDGLTMFFSADDSSDARAGRMFVHAAVLDSGFTVPLIWALYAFSNAGDGSRYDSVMNALEARREHLPRLDRALLDMHAEGARGNPIGSYDALRRVVAIAPNSEWVFKLGTAAAVLRRLTEADSLLRAIDPDTGWLRDWAGYWTWRSDVAYGLGRHDEELTMVSRGTERFPRQLAGARGSGRALAALGRTSEVLSLVDAALASSPPRIDSEGLFRIINAARVHGHLDLAKAVARRALARPVTGVDLGDSVLTRVRFELLTLEAAEMWDAALPSAVRMIRFDSLRARHDALPYMVLLQAALRQGRLSDTAGLEARARSEAGARPKADVGAGWNSESELVVETELAALHHDVPGMRTLLNQAVERDWHEYFWFSERPAYDGVRTDPALSMLLHNPAREGSFVLPVVLGNR